MAKSLEKTVTQYFRDWETDIYATLARVKRSRKLGKSEELGCEADIAEINTAVQQMAPLLERACMIYKFGGNERQERIKRYYKSTPDEDYGLLFNTAEEVGQALREIAVDTPDYRVGRINDRINRTWRNVEDISCATYLLAKHVCLMYPDVQQPEKGLIRQLFGGLRARPWQTMTVGEQEYFLQHYRQADEDGREPVEEPSGIFQWLARLKLRLQWACPQSRQMLNQMVILEQLSNLRVLRCLVVRVSILPMGLSTPRCPQR
jgi:hypothetical protein